MKIAKIALISVFCMGLVCLLGVTLSGRSFVRIVSNSMEPEIKTGSLIVGRKPPSADDLKVGDVIIYKTNGANKQVIMTHRIVTAESQNGETVFKTQGDNAPSPDHYVVKYEDIVGIHNGKAIPFVGNFISFLVHPIGLITATLTVVSCLVLFAFFKRKFLN
jgi:signal peptidase